MPGIVLNKRPPEMARELYGRYTKISKADWADLYFDFDPQKFAELITSTGVTAQQAADALVTIAPAMDKAWQTVLANDALWQARAGGAVWQSAHMVVTKKTSEAIP